MTSATKNLKRKLPFNPYATLTVGKSLLNSDYLDIQSAIDNLPTGGGTIEIGDGIFTITAPILFRQNNTIIKGKGGSTIIQGNNSVVSPFVKANAVGLSNCELRNVVLQGTNTPTIGTAIDLSAMVLTVVHNVKVSTFNLAMNMDDKNGTAINTNITFYNTVERFQAFNVTKGIEVKNLANHNYFKDIRIGINGTAVNAPGILISESQGIHLENFDVEPSSISQSVGIDITGLTVGVSIQNPWVEGNFIGIRVAAGVVGVNISGGTISANTTNVIDPQGIITHSNSIVEYQSTNKASGYVSNILGATAKDAFSAVIDTSAGTVNAFKAANNTNFAHSGHFYVGDFKNTSDTGNILELNHNGTGKIWNVKQNNVVVSQMNSDGSVYFANKTTAQKNAIPAPHVGLMVFDTDLQKLCVRTSGGWQTISST
jgi:hypothetical protein